MFQIYGYFLIEQQWILMNKCPCVRMQLPLSIHPRVSSIARSWGRLISSCWGTATQITKVTYEFALPTAMYEYSSYSTFLPTGAVTCFIYPSHSDWCKIKRQSGLIWLSMMAKNVKLTFKSVKAIWSFSFENYLFTIGITLLLAIEFFSSFYFGY